MRKAVYLLNVDGYVPGITALTYPLIRYWANRIGATVRLIDKRYFPDWPVVYEKLQIYSLAKQFGDDWNIYIDSDALVHPETVDFTEFLDKDTVAHHGADMAAVRWKYDRFFRRDGRNIGSCNWFAMASDWCIELWEPMEIPLAEALDNIQPTVEEIRCGITREHLIDDYALSRNIARYGLKFETVTDLTKRIGLPESNFFWHAYTITPEQKIEEMTKIIDGWNVPKSIRNA